MAGEASPRWAVNDRIRHRVFGEGRIVRVREKDVLDIDFAGRRRSGAGRMRSPAVVGHRYSTRIPQSNPR